MTELKQDLCASEGAPGMPIVVQFGEVIINASNGEDLGYLAYLQKYTMRRTFSLFEEDKPEEDNLEADRALQSDPLASLEEVYRSCRLNQYP